MSKQDFLKALTEVKEELKKEMKDSRLILERSIRSDIRELKSEITSLKDELLEIDATMHTLQSECERVKAENVSLVSRCSELENTTKELNNRIVDLEQHTRSRNIEIKGIPFRSDEKLIDILTNLGKKLDVNLSCGDYDAYHRVPHIRQEDTSPQNIIVQFRNKQLRDDVLLKSKQLRLKCSDIGFPLTTPIYINEHLCPQIKRLLGATVAKKKEHGWKFVWCKNGKIYVRKSEKSEKRQVRCLDDLAKLSP